MFDPYHKWLAIPKDQRPPNHYQMLGLAVGETDPDVIDEAALRQTAHVRTYQLGPHGAECTRILNEIALARTTLLNPAKKKDYDAQLAKKAERAPARSDQIAAKPAAQAIAKEFAFEDPDEPIVHAGPDARTAKKTAKAPKAEPKLHKEGVFLTKGMLIGIVGGAAAFLVLVVVILIAFVGKGGDPKSDKRVVAQTKKGKDKKKGDELPPVDPDDKKPPDIKPPKKNPPKKGPLEKVDPPIAIADPPELPKDANGLFIQGEIDCGKESLRRDIGKDFDITKSWVLSCGFWLTDLQDDGPRQFLIWGDERGGYDPIHLSQIGNRIYTRITDCQTDGQHAIEVPFRPIAEKEWHKVTVRYQADARTLELFLDDRLVAKEKSRILPTVDRPMPLWIGSFLGQHQRFKGKLRELRLGNIDASAVAQGGPRLVPISMEIVAGDKRTPVRSLRGCIPIGKNLDLLWTDGSERGLFLMKDKGQLQQLWRVREPNWSIMNACFDGRYVWASVRRHPQAPLLVVLDPESEEVREYTSADGLPFPEPDKELAQVLDVAPVGPGKACLVGWHGQSWLAIATHGPAEKFKVNVFHKAAEPGKRSDQEQAKSDAAVAFEPKGMYVLLGPADGKGVTPRRIILSRDSSTNDMIQYWPLLIDPDNLSVMVAPEKSYGDNYIAGDVQDGSMFFYQGDGRGALHFYRLAFPGTKLELIAMNCPQCVVAVSGDRFHLFASNLCRTGSISKKLMGPPVTLAKIVSRSHHSAHYGILCIYYENGHLLPFQFLDGTTGASEVPKTPMKEPPVAGAPVIDMKDWESKGVRITELGKEALLEQGDGGMPMVLTRKSFKLPVTFRAIVQTDSTNVRMYYDRGEVILNWESKKSELRIHDLKSRQAIGFPGKGYITENEYHDVKWQLRKDGMTVIVDGKPRLVHRADYSSLPPAPIGIGPANGSKIKVRQLEVIQ